MKKIYLYMVGLLQNIYPQRFCDCAYELNYSIYGRDSNILGAYGRGDNVVFFSKSGINNLKERQNFDYIVGSNLFESIPDVNILRICLKKLAKILRDDGIVFISLINYSKYLLEIYKKTNNDRYYLLARKNNFYCFDEVIDLLNEYFDVDEISFLHSIPEVLAKDIPNSNIYNKSSYVFFALRKKESSKVKSLFYNIYKDSTLFRYKGNNLPLYTRVDKFEINKKKSKVIFSHSPSSFSFDMNIDKKSKIFSQITLDSKVWMNKAEDGVTFKINLICDREKINLGGKYINPHKFKKDCKWHNLEVLVDEKFLNKKIYIEFEVEPGIDGKGIDAYSWTGWKNLKLIKENG